MLFMIEPVLEYLHLPTYTSLLFLVYSVFLFIYPTAKTPLRAECRSIMRQQGKFEETGTAKITPAYCLPSDFILHTVGPVYPDTGERPDLLASCYIECLKLCKEKGVRSLAFCCISTGIFGYPQEPATRVALSTVKQFLETDQNWKNFDSVVFNVFKDDDLALYEKIIPEYFGTNTNGRPESPKPVRQNQTDAEDERGEKCSCSVVFNVFKDDDLALYEKIIPEYFGTNTNGRPESPKPVRQNQTDAEDERGEKCSCC
eukprot:TRINITY_DN2204_c0_g1_i2.p2 TRINITY_DN2204_c0_g1~~TRINITY_DN2204_c0_g1_i2.p2  ORF type:complete len:258 (-),score=22.10 TRINITY_DN2204_c0_g1_i2:131-904(-)